MQQKLWNELPADKQKEMIKQEENAVFNQVVLFVSRVIWLRCPLELSESNMYCCMVALTGPIPRLKGPSSRFRLKS